MRMNTKLKVLISILLCISFFASSATAIIPEIPADTEPVPSLFGTIGASEQMSLPVGPRGEPPDVLWNNTFGTSFHDEKARDIKKTNDGGYIVTGYAQPVGADADAWLLKVDAEGNKLWNTTFGGCGSEIAYAVLQTDDSGYILTGESRSTDTSGDGFVIKTDSLGNMLWNFSFGVPGGEDFGYKLIESSDNNYIVVGTTNLLATQEMLIGNATLLKIDQQGSLIWQKTYGGETIDAGFSVDQTDDYGFIISGFTYSYATGEAYVDAWLLKTDAQGNELWNLSIGYEYAAEVTYDVIQTNDGSYALTGYSSTNGDMDVLLIKTDGKDSHEIFTYDRSKLDVGQSFDQTDDEGFIIVGTTMNWYDNEGGCVPGWDHIDFWIFKTDKSGKLEWDTYYGGKYADTAYAVQQTSDDGFIVAGYCIKLVDGNQYTRDAWLMNFGTKEEPEVTIQDVKPGIGSLNITFENTGAVLCGCAWNISVQGGILKNINVSEKGAVYGLPAGESVSVDTEKPIFGLGKISVEITASYARPWSGSAFVIGPFILHIQSTS